MPIGIQRLNARTRPPNDRVIFIKPLEGPDKALAQDFLERIAAICQPIMKANHLSVMSLEEFEPNLEFVGRNFNAGEVIQLVLKAPFTGHWLPFKHVQMVMMHELAHCKEMNHSRAFYKVRNQYADELRGLWGKGYTGEGFWSKGKTLLSEQYMVNSMPETEVMPKSLCGGTYRRVNGKKRKRKADGKPQLTYAERQQRRVLKKFGSGGVALGGEEATRVKLENGKKLKGKPRVAGSARGRELRAAAALARFDQAKKEDGPKEGEKKGDAEVIEITSDSETESEYDEVDREILKLLDVKGDGMVKVCEGEDQDNADVKREMQELRELDDDD